MDFTKEIDTPIGKHKVVIKTMLTGAEREKVDSAQMELAKTTDGIHFEITDMQRVVTIQDHTLLKIAVVSIDGDGTNCFERLQKAFEPDYKFVLNTIKEEQKKMMDTTSAPS